MVRLGGKTQFSTKRPVMQPKKPVSTESFDPFDDDENLTCRICKQAFWYESQIIEHLGTNHKVEDPVKFLREKRKL